MSTWISILLLLLSFFLSSIESAGVLDIYGGSSPSAQVMYADNPQFQGVFVLITLNRSSDITFRDGTNNQLVAITDFDNGKIDFYYGLSTVFQSFYFQNPRELLFFDVMTLKIEYPAFSRFTIWYFSDACSSNSMSQCTGNCDSYCIGNQASYCWSSTNSLRTYQNSFVSMDRFNGSCMKNPFDFTKPPTFAPTTSKNSSSNSDRSTAAIFLGTLFGLLFWIMLVRFVMRRCLGKFRLRVSPHNIRTQAMNELMITQQKKVVEIVPPSEILLDSKQEVEDAPMPYELAVSSARN